MKVEFGHLQVSSGYGGACEPAVGGLVGLEVGVARERVQIAAQAEPGLVVERADLRVVGGLAQETSEVDADRAAAFAAGGRLDLVAAFDDEGERVKWPGGEVVGVLALFLADVVVHAGDRGAAPR